MTLGQLIGARARAVYRAPLPPTHHPLPESRSSGSGGRASWVPCAPWQVIVRLHLLELLGRWSQLSWVQACSCLAFPCSQSSTPPLWLLNSLQALPPREPQSLVGGLWYRRQFAAGLLSVVCSPHSHQLWLPFPPGDASWSGAGSAVTFGCGLFRNRTMYTSWPIEGFAPILHYPFSGSLCPVE